MYFFFNFFSPLYLPITSLEHPTKLSGYPKGLILPKI
jgi:hypothetical protein